MLYSKSFLTESYDTFIIETLIVIEDKNGQIRDKNNTM